VAEGRVQRRLAAILAADVVGYSRLIEQDEAGTRTRLRKLHAELIDPRINQDGGRIVKMMGDGVLVEFPSAIAAVENALSIQKSIAEHEASQPEERRIRFRVGINVGDVIVEEDDIHGEGVNVAARLEGLCQPGEIYVSGTVYDQAAGKLEAAFDDLGEQTVKNIAKPVRTYRVLWNPNEADPARQTTASDTLPLPDKPSIAVLPFENMSGDPEQQYFSDGMAEDLITDLSKISGLFVVARNSSFSFKGQAVEAKEIGEKLGVKNILEGSVRKMGAKLRVNAQLIDAASGGHLWAERYDGDMADIFDFQDSIRDEIISALEVKLTPGDRALAERKPSTSIEAYDLFLKGRASYFRYTPQDHAEAKSYFEGAIALDPEFADAYSFLSYLYSAAWNLLYPGFENGLDRALPMAEKAVSLDPRSPVAHMRLGWILCFLRQFDQALPCFEKAVDLGPDIAEVCSYYGMFLNYIGRPEQGLDMIDRAYRLDPIAPTIWELMVGYSYWELARYDDAVAQFRKVIDRLPDFPMTYMFLASVYAELGQLDAAAEELRTLREKNPLWSVGNADRIFPILSDDRRKRFLDNLRQAGLPE